MRPHAYERATRLTDSASAAPLKGTVGAKQQALKLQRRGNMRLLVCIAVALLFAGPLVESQRLRYGPGVCGPLDATYIKIATETGGQPYPVSPDELGTSPGIIGAASLRQMILWASGEQERSYEIPVDSTVTRMMLSGTFDGTGGSVAVIAPNGTVVQRADGVEDTLLNCGRVITVDAPAAGTWQVRVAPNRRFWLAVRARSDLSMTHAEFVEPHLGSERERLVRIQGEPIAGRPATLRVSLEGPIKSPSFHLIALDARPLHTVDLQTRDGIEFSGSIELPREPFRLMVNGQDESGLPVQRIWRGLFHGEPIQIVPPGGETITAGAALPVTFTIRNHGPAVRVSLVAVDGRGRVVAVDPPALDLAADAEGAATVRLLVPADAQPQSEVSIRLTATTDSSAAVGGFNSANKTFIVIRE